MALVLGNGSNAGESALLAALAFACAAWALGPQASEAALLPRVRLLYPLAAPLLGAIGLAAIDALTGLPGISVYDVMIISTVAGAISFAGSAWGWARARRDGPVRVAVIGSDRSARHLASSLVAAGQRGYQVVGRISTGADDAQGRRRVLGTLEDLAAAVDEHDLDLLLIGGEAPRLRVFDEMARSCLERRVRLAGMADFTEQVFGHVPIGSINAAWFQYILHPRFRVDAPTSKRVLDVTGALMLGLLSLPLMAAVALLIRRDGGPVLFRQLRVGERGKPFLMLKLRTMRPGVSNVTEWASLNDPRITGVGRFLRWTHLDELPQLLHVLRGEMSLVGPRPEQPSYVAQLERQLPFYERRHLIKPGLTGWAQVRCGYAGSDAGSAWKLCHDLFYVKRRSLALDLLILAETATQALGRAPVTLWMEQAPIPARALEEVPPPAPSLPAAASSPSLAATTTARTPASTTTPTERPRALPDRAPVLAGAAGGLSAAVALPTELPWFPRAVNGDGPLTGAFLAARGELEFEPIADLEELREPWNELAERSGNVFSSWEWAETWWRHFGAERPLLLTACHDRAGRLVAILPLYLAASRPLRVVRFLGHGAGDQLGPVCAPEDAETVARALRGAIDLRARRWDVLLADRLHGSESEHLRGTAVLRREPSPLLTLDHASWDDYLATRSANFRQQLRRRERALARDHDLRYRLSESPETLERDLETLFALHAARWAESPVPTPFAGAALDFHRDFAATASKRGWLRLWTMELDGVPAAAWYGFRFAEVESYYQAGRDPAREHGSIGLVLLAHSVRAALEDGMREYRFLRGAEDFKRRFTDEDPGVVTVALARTMAGRASIAAAGAALAPRGRAARRVVRRAAALAG